MSRPSSARRAGCRGATCAADSGARATLPGAVTGTSARAGVPVVVEADPWPNDKHFVVVRRVHTRGDGRFVLHVAPDRITAYRARSGRLRSPSTTMQVAPDPRVSLSVIGHTAQAHVRIRMPAGAPLAHVRVHLYVARGAGTRLRHAGSGALVRAGRSATADISYPSRAPAAGGSSASARRRRSARRTRRTAPPGSAARSRGSTGSAERGGGGRCPARRGGWRAAGGRRRPPAPRAARRGGR